jgi:hypothetical protein
MQPGIMPQNNPIARITERWILEWMKEHSVADPHIALRELAKRAAAHKEPVSGDEITALGKALLGLLPADGE